MDSKTYLASTCAKVCSENIQIILNLIFRLVKKNLTHIAGEQIFYVNMILQN